jgi:predicted metalloprotease
MRWERGYQSSNVEDRRGMSAGGGGGGLFFLLFMLFRRFGIAGVLVGIVVIGAWYAFSGSGGESLTGNEGAAQGARDDEMKSFVSFVLDDTQRTWAEIKGKRGEPYQEATLVLFTSRVDSACGLASAAVGPFYCPGDRKVYIDLSFYHQLRERLGAPGDFAQAYVIAHEIGHHVQNLQGNLRGNNGAGAGGGQVRIELQADCYAGVWAHATGQRQLLEDGDIEEAMRAAEAIGDDTLQEAGRGTVQPETWTHGSSAQRMRWFKRGFSSGSPDACDTFNAAEL